MREGERFMQFLYQGVTQFDFPRVAQMDFRRKAMQKQDKDCCYEEMSGGGKLGGQSITKIDNSIHSEYHNPPMINEYENSRKGWNANGMDWSGMKGKK